jgi:hypothetical protein
MSPDASLRPTTPAAIRRTAQNTHLPRILSTMITSGIIILLLVVLVATDSVEDHTPPVK